MSEIKPMLTTEEVARRLSVARMTVMRMIEAGELPAVKLGRVWRIDPEQLDEYLFRQGNESYRTKAKARV